MATKVRQTRDAACMNGRQQDYAIAQTSRERSFTDVRSWPTARIQGSASYCGFTLSRAAASRQSAHGAVNAFDFRQIHRRMDCRYCL